jgi:4-hydroxy-tetrahydrodipicolinate reductase
MLRIALTGASGRMGRTVIKVVSEDRESVITGATDAVNSPYLGLDAGDLGGIGRKLDVPVIDDVGAAMKNADVLIDFSVQSAASVNIKSSMRLNKAIVIGTTGLNDEDMKVLREAGEKIPVIWAPNFSAGINLLAKLTEIAAKVLGGSFDAEIVEKHHRNKKDSPSGTAIRLLKVLKDVYKTDDVVYGRKGTEGERPSGQIGVFAVRGGDVVGDHTVGFYGDGERLELTHLASSRETFAKGALRAAKFIYKNGPGLYTIEEVLGLNQGGSL